MKTLNIGRLNKRLTFLKLADSEDEIGQTVQKLKPYRTVWGSLYPVRGTEFYEIQKIQSKVTHKCYVRYLPGIDTNCYIRFKDKTYSVESVINVNLENKMLEILCSEYINKEEMREDE